MCTQPFPFPLSPFRPHLPPLRIHLDPIFTPFSSLHFHFALTSSPHLDPHPPVVALSMSRQCFRVIPVCIDAAPQPRTTCHGPHDWQPLLLVPYLRSDHAHVVNVHVGSHPIRSVSCGLRPASQSKSVVQACDKSCGSRDASQSGSD